MELKRLTKGFHHGGVVVLIVPFMELKLKLAKSFTSEIVRLNRTFYGIET